MYTTIIFEQHLGTIMYRLIDLCSDISPIRDDALHKNILRNTVVWRCQGRMTGPTRI